MIKLVDLYNKRGPRCVWCDTRTILPPPGGYAALAVVPNNSATREHLLPRAAGGTNALDNLAIACYRCNTSRRAQMRANLRDAEANHSVVPPEVRT